MGNNSSSPSTDSASPSSVSTCRAAGSSWTERTHSLPLANHHQYRYRHQQFHHTHSDRRCMTNAAAVSSSPMAARRASSRFRQALPNFVTNVSAAIGHKLPWTSAGAGSRKRKYQKSPPSNVGASVNNGKGEKRSRSKTREHCRLFRELVNDWRLSDLHCLVVEFEAALASRELKRRTDCARMLAAGLKDDFTRLFQKINPGDQLPRDDSSADAFLVLESRTFAVHRAFLSRRCSFFRRLFGGCSSLDDVDGSSSGNWRPTIPVTFSGWTTPLNSDTLALLLEYLYTGELGDTTNKEEHVRALVRFKEEQGQVDETSTLQEDVASMLTELNDPDAVLIFTNSKNASVDSSMAIEDDEGETSIVLEDDPRAKRAPLLLVVEKQKAKCCQFKCHSVVLAARSPFFRAIIRKRRLQDEQQQNDQNEQFLNGRSASSPFSPWKRPRSPRSPSGLLEIVLDESVIPRQYAPVLLHAMYTDQVDLSLVMRDCVASAASCLTEVQAIAAGKCQLSPIDEATEIYQIARFLEFDKLAQGCEDVIVSYISLDTLPSIYTWSSESYGSAYVRRQCINYLCQEFGRFCATPLLFETDETLLVEVLKSDYVQASELEILNAIIRWGEHQLVRRIEEREPNILMGTTHSISRKGVKRADLSDEELKEILADLLPLIRIDYVLPPNHAVLENAISRGLLSVPCMDLLSGSQSGGAVLLPPQVAARRQRGNRHSPSALVRSCSSSGSPTTSMEHKSREHWSKPHRRSAGPRLFLPYLDESRALLEKKVAEAPEQLSALINHHPPVETVTDRLFTMQRSSSAAINRYPDTLYMVDGTIEHSRSFDDTETEVSEIAVPPSSTLLAVQERVDRLLGTSSTVKRALACGCSYHRSGVLKQVRLRALREFGLLDSTLAVLDTYGQLASPSSMEYGHPSFCSSAPLSPMDAAQGIDTEMDMDGPHYLPPSPAKRRFRSQPELSQCDLTGCSSTFMEWPDLMATSMAGLSPTRRVASSSSMADWAVAGEADSTNSPCTSWEKYEDEWNARTGSKEHLRQQLVDLTQQICDLVVVERDGDGDSQNGRNTAV